MLKKPTFIRFSGIILSLLLTLSLITACRNGVTSNKDESSNYGTTSNNDPTSANNEPTTSNNNSTTSNNNPTSASNNPTSANNDHEIHTGNSNDDFNNSGREKRLLSSNDDKNSGSEQPTAEYTYKTANWHGPNGYVIIYAQGNRSTRAAAKKLQAYFRDNAGVTLTVADDKTSVKSKEILVGDTNRRTSKLATGEYKVSLINDVLFFEAGHFAMVELEVDWFTSLKYVSGEVNLVNGQRNDFASSKSGYIYVWGDEFGGKNLDTAKWGFKDRMAGTNMMPCLTNSSVVNVNDGLLKMTAVRYYDKTLPMAQYATNSSVCTQDTMSFLYGYFEMRAKIPLKQGAWPSWWFLSDDALGNKGKAHVYDVEIDVFEAFSSRNTLVPNIHKWYRDGKHTMYNGSHYLKKSANNYTFTSLNNLVNEYHIYGFEWTPQKMTMLVDGVPYMTFDLTDNFDNIGNMDDFHSPLFAILNNFIYAPDLVNTNSSNIVNNADLPFEYYVDWIRLYQKPGVGSLNFPDTIN